MEHLSGKLGIMKIRHRRVTCAALAFSTVLSLALVSGCGSEDRQAENPAARGATTERPGAAAEPSHSPSGRSGTHGRDGSRQSDVKVPKHKKPRIDWAEFLRDPANYLLGGTEFPGGYSARTLSLSERGKAIQDVGRAGVSVENFPNSCNGAAGRIGSANDQIAMQMASKQNHSLTLVVINNSDPTAAVSAWADKNDQCPTFLSQENGVTSTVYVEKTDAPEISGSQAVGYLITTKTTNLRGSTTQEQLLYAVPMGEVVVEVMGMNFGGPVSRGEVDDVLQNAVKKSTEVEQKAAEATRKDANESASTSSTSVRKSSVTHSPRTTTVRPAEHHTAED